MFENQRYDNSTFSKDVNKLLTNPLIKRALDHGGFIAGGLGRQIFNKRSLRRYFREGKGDISIFWIKDKFPVGGENYYRFYEWATMFKTVWGDESYIGLDQKKYSTASLASYKFSFNKRYNLSEFDPDGRHAALTIHRGVHQYSDLELSIRYLYYKWLSKTGLTKFLSGITDIEIQPIPVSK